MRKRNKTQEWVNLLARVTSKKELAICPSCGSVNIHYKMKRITKDGRGFGLVWCSDCMRGIWMSRMAVGEDCGEEPPLEIKYY